MPAFTVGFVLTPLASNASELVSSLKFAARKRITNMSLTLAQGEPSCACNCARPRTLAGLEAGARGGSGWATQACTGGYGQPALDAPTATRTGLQSKHVSGVPLHTHTTPCSPHTQPWHANRLQARARCIGGRAINRPCAPPHCPPDCCLQAKWALPAIALYPLSLLTVHLLDTKLGWQ